MTEHKVEKIAQDFVKEWSEYLVVNPFLALDYSWPSLGVLDLLTFSCRYKKNLPSQLEEIVTGASAYIAVIAKNCFVKSVEKVVLTHDKDGINIILEGGRYIAEEENVVIPVEKMLKHILAELPNPLPVTRLFKTEILFESPIISLFAVGIVTGLAPGIEGAWSDKSEKYLSEVIAQSLRVLAIGSSNHYARYFPNEKLGQMGELYLNDLIFPPMMMRENLPLLGSIDKVLKYFSEYKISKESALKLGQNLALSPDHLFSNLGLVLCCALSDEIPSPQILANCQRKGTYITFLRRAVKEVRKYFGVKYDWVENGLKNSEMLTQYAVEKSMKFLPWLNLSKDRIKSDVGDYILAPLIIKICEYDISGALKIAEQILEARPDDTEIVMQIIRLELMQGNSERVDDLLRDLMSNPKADSMMEYYSLLGNIALAKNDPTKALNNYKAAIALKTKDLTLLSDVQNNAAWCCMHLKKFGQALVYLEQSLMHTQCPVTILLNKASIIAEMGDLSGSLEIRKKLFSICPFDRRVFAALTLEEVLNINK